jgi:hypothetical protein
MATAKPKTNKILWGLGLVAVILTLLLVLRLVGFQLEIGFRPGGGDGKGNVSNPGTGTTTPTTTPTTAELRPSTPYSFYFSKDAIFYQDQKISWNRMELLFHEAHEKSDSVELAFEEATVTNGFTERVKKLVIELKLTTREVHITRDK